jgi:hypothetical protein
MTEYEKIKRITLLVDLDHLLLVTTEMDTEHMKVLDGILKKIGGLIASQLLAIKLQTIYSRTTQIVFEFRNT